MALLKISRLGHPVLLRVADRVEDPTSEEIRRLAADMIETMSDAGGVGIAAPQVHVSKRVIVFSAPPHRIGELGGDEVPVTVLVNPEFEPVGEERVLGWEGCLSIPGLRGAVPRWQAIRYRGTGLSGEAIDCTATGFHARVVQHEIDHLDGLLYPMRMNDLSLLAFNEEWQRNLAQLDIEGRPA